MNFFPLTEQARGGEAVGFGEGSPFKKSTPYAA